MSITKHIQPKKKKRTGFVQARVEDELLNAVKSKLLANKVTVTQFIVAAMRQYLEEK